MRSIVPTTTITMPSASSAYSGCADDRTTRLLTLLHSYQVLHGRGDASLKSCVWNVTKARRDRSYVGTSSAEYSVECVREELRPWALLEEEVGAEGESGEGGGEQPPPGLVEETSNELGNLERASLSLAGDNGGGDGKRFVLHLDGMRAAKEKSNNLRHSLERIENDGIIAEAEKKENQGLRRRRGGNPSADAGGKDGSEKWTTETPHNESDSDRCDDEEESRLRSADPLSLFGVPPPALRVAQSNSRAAVAYYVEAANSLREILDLIDRKECG